MYVLGLDVGSVVTKSVLMDDRKIVFSNTGYSSGDFQSTASAMIDAVLERVDLDGRDSLRVFSTGCGAEMVPSSKAHLNDISCQARGVNYLFPSIRTIIEISGRSTKVIKVDGQGRVVNFATSERCAASSGKFLQLISRITGIDIDRMGEVSLRSKKGVKFTTGCAVFAETEVISRIAEGITVEDILAGVYEIMANKAFNLLRGIEPEGDIAVTGGGAKDSGLVRAIERRLEREVYVPKEPFITAALGAALIGEERLQE